MFLKDRWRPDGSAAENRGPSGGTGQDMGSRMKTLGVCLAILATGAVGFGALKMTKPAPPQAPAEAGRPLVRVMDVTLGDFRATIEESGTVAPKTVLDLTAEVAGTLVFVSDAMQVGYFVRKGQLLAEVDPREYRLSVAQSEAELAQLAAEKAKLDQEEENITRHLEVEISSLHLSKMELDRKQKLLESGSISQSEVDKQAIDTKQKEVSVVNQQNALALLKSQEDLVEAKIEATRAKKELAEIKLEKTKIFAPFEGRVQEESIEPGQYVQIGQKLATLYDTSAMEIVVNFSPTKMAHWIDEETREQLPPLEDLAQINDWMRKHGPAAEVSFKWARGVKTWKGKVTRLKGALDAATRTIPVVVEVKNPLKDVQPGSSPPLLPGMFVTVKIQGAVLKSVVKVPRSAIHAGSVYLVKDGKLAIKPVRVEALTREEAIISNGLEMGDKLILSPIPMPMPGMELRTAEVA